MESVSKAVVDKSGATFSELNAIVQATFNKNMAAHGPKLFVVSIPNPEELAKPLFAQYLAGFPEAERQHHNCRCCSQFIHRFGDLAFVSATGELVSALWDAAAVPDEFKDSVARMQQAVVRSTEILHPFTEVPGNTLGIAETNGWNHFQIKHPDLDEVAKDKVGELRGKGIEKHEQLTKTLATYPVVVIRDAAHLLQGDILNMSHKYRGVAERMLSFATSLENIKNLKHRSNLIWRESASVGEAYTHANGNVLGRLMDDVAAGKPTHVIIRNSNLLTDPTVYQRVVAAPTQGNVQVAIKIMTELGMTEDDLMRRAARLEEIETFWKPTEAKAPEAKPAGMFADLVTKEAEAKPVDKPLIAPEVKVTLRTFMEEVINKGKALSMQMYISAAPLADINFTAPVKEDAGRLFWFDDHEDRRVRISWFTKDKPIAPRDLNLAVGSWVNITALADVPPMWFNASNPRSQEFSVCAAILEGAQMKLDCTMCLFPELLHPDLREISRVIETFSKNRKLIDNDKGTTTGTPLGRGSHLVRVTTALGISTYRIEGLK